MNVLKLAVNEPGRLEYTGVGSTEPRYKPESTPENRARNRRVEIVHVAQAAHQAGKVIMFALFKRRWFLSALGLLLLAAFIWWAGPYFAFADFRPLATVTARLVAIGLIVGLVAGLDPVEAVQGEARERQAGGAAVVAQDAARPQEARMHVPCESASRKRWPRSIRAAVKVSTSCRGT